MITSEILVLYFKILDPILQLLIRHHNSSNSTGLKGGVKRNSERNQNLITYKILKPAFPLLKNTNKKNSNDDKTNEKEGSSSNKNDKILRKCLKELNKRGVLRVIKGDDDADDLYVGFPEKKGKQSTQLQSQSSLNSNNAKKNRSISGTGGGGLHTLSKAGFQRRLKALEKSLSSEPISMSVSPSQQQHNHEKTTEKKTKHTSSILPTSSDASTGGEKRKMCTSVGNKETVMLTLSTCSSSSSLSNNNKNNNNEDNSTESPEKRLRTTSSVQENNFSNKKKQSTRSSNDAFDELSQFFQSAVDNDSDSDTEEGEEKEYVINNPFARNTQIFSSLRSPSIKYAGSQHSRVADYYNNPSLPTELTNILSSQLLDVFQLNYYTPRSTTTTETSTATTTIDNKQQQNLLFSHQMEALDSILLKRNHTFICTGTGSGKSLCFLLPIFASILTPSQQQRRRTSFIIYPTKALANDQYHKLKNLLVMNNDISSKIQIGILDGDTPHSTRLKLVESCNIILTNPDTLHHCILPSASIKMSSTNRREKKTTVNNNPYQQMLKHLSYVVIDEAHVYHPSNNNDIAFGAHVSLILSRLYRLASVLKQQQKKEQNEINNDKEDSVLFIGCSATLSCPESHFRSLCPISKDEKVNIIAKDGSPCGSKHFFLWNPPFERQSQRNQQTSSFSTTITATTTTSSPSQNTEQSWIKPRSVTEETALWLAKAIFQKKKVIAFCSSRNAVESVYSHTIRYFRDYNKESLIEKLEAYRGGYSKENRHLIEQKLFSGEILGVVSTSALELGIDVGGIDLTLHCSYPGNLFSLFQQSGRAGRTKYSFTNSKKTKYPPSFAMIICSKNSPTDQILFYYPKKLLLSSSPQSKNQSNITISSQNNNSNNNEGRTKKTIFWSLSVVRQHLACAIKEYPLAIQQQPLDDNSILTESDHYELFGSRELYIDAIEKLKSEGHLIQQNLFSQKHYQTHQLLSFFCYTIHPSIQNPWSMVSLRSVEPITYNIVNVGHPLQGNKTDKVYNNKAIFDQVPYSRIFHYIYPGAIITHRAKKYKVLKITSPPSTYSIGQYHYHGFRNTHYAAYAKEITSREGSYYYTKAKTDTKITITKRFESLEESSRRKQNKNDNVMSSSSSEYTISGQGVISIKKTIHGYVKISTITQKELSRHELLTIPPMEYETNAFWIPLTFLIREQGRKKIPNFDHGVHALSHALLAVSQQVLGLDTSNNISASTSMIDCEHNFSNCTRILLFDARPGGNGISSYLFNNLTQLLQKAVNLLEQCPLSYSSCPCLKNQDNTPTKNGNSKSQLYDGGGCPGCIHLQQNTSSVATCNNQGLSRLAALDIAKILLQKVQQQDKARTNTTTATNHGDQNQIVHHPKKQDEESKKNRLASDLVSAQKRSFVIGRPSWLDNQSSKEGNDDDSNDGAIYQEPPEEDDFLYYNKRSGCFDDSNEGGFFK